MMQVMNYPHCHLNFSLQFSTPTGRDKTKNDGSFLVIYMYDPFIKEIRGHNIERFCNHFSSLGFIPGYNTWSFRPYLQNFLLDDAKVIENARLKHDSMILPNSKEILDHCYRVEINEQLINSIHTLAEPLNNSPGSELLRCDHTSENSIF